MPRTTYKLLHLRPDETYRLQLRARVNGITGKWSAAFEFDTALDTVPPGPVQNLELGYADSLFVLSWDPPTTDAEGRPLTDLAKYRVTIIDNVSSDEEMLETQGTLMEFTLQFLKFIFDGLSGDYTFRVTAVDRAGNESTAEDVTFEATPPGPFSMTTWTGASQTITVFWNESADIDLSHYEVYRNGILVGRTAGTETEYVDGNPGPGEHTYYAIAYDAFGLNTQSTNSIIGAKTYGYWQGDITVPKPPQGLTFDSEIAAADGSTADVTVQFTAPTENVDSSEYEDHNEFIIEWAKALDGPWQSLRIADTRPDGSVAANFEVGITDLLSSTPYHFRVAAADRYNNRSAWAYGSHTTVTDAQAPSRPTAPTVAGGLLRVQVSHDMQAEGGGQLEEDVRELKVYIGTTSGFTPSASNYVGALSTLKTSTGFKPVGSFPVEATNYKYVKVVAVDVAGNESIPSSAANSEDIQLVQDAYIENASITNASIANLSAAKLIAGTAFVNDLKVESLFTVQSGGIMQSSNYLAGQTGWQLSEAGLEINDGVVSAAALTINNSPNLIAWAYASFEVEPLWLFGGTDAGGNTVDAKVVATSKAGNSDITADGWEGERSLRFRSATDTSSGSPAEILFTPGTSTYEIDAEPAQRFVVSFYAKSNSAYTFSVLAHWQGSATTESVKQVTINNTGGKWRRFYVVFTAPAGATGMYTGLRTIAQNVDVNFDALQVELVTSNVIDSMLVPAAWKSPTQTTIDGGMIRTGEIKSSNYEAGGTNRWRLGLEGNLTANNAFLTNVQAEGGYLQNLSVYGTIVVGAGGTTGLIRANNFSWSLNGNGNLSASNANISGTISATSGTFQGVTAYSITVGSGSTNGYIQSHDFGSLGSASGWRIGNTAVSGYQAIFNNIYAKGNITANSIVSGTTITSPIISGGSITGTTIQTDDSGQRIVMTSSQMTIYGHLGNLGGYIYGRNNINSITNNYMNNAIYLSSAMSDLFYAGIGIGVGASTRLNSSSIQTSTLTVNGITLDGNLNASGTLTLSTSGTAINVSGGGNVSMSNSGTTISVPGGAQIIAISSTAAFYGRSGAGIMCQGSVVSAVNRSNTTHVTLRGIIDDMSSIEAKRDIKPVASVLNEIDRMRFVEFEFKSGAEGKRFGIIAEEIEAIDYRLSRDGVVSPTGLASYALSGVQELHKRVRTLEAELAKVKQARSPSKQ